jgi:ABC-type branched-subunit amino acid transport system substrate-binding protein
MQAGVELAVAEINEAGGVNGGRITLIPADDGTDPTVATQATSRLLQQNVDAIVGPAASAIGKAIIESVTSAGVVLFSPGNTSDEFTTINDRGLYFRTAPPDALQARLIANVMVQEGRGSDVIAVMHQNTGYGTGLANEIKRNLLAADTKPADIVLVGYDPANHDYTPQLRKLKSARPDFIVLAGYEESVDIVRALNAAGIGPRR